MAFNKNEEYKYCVTIFINVSIFWIEVVMKENRTFHPLYSLEKSKHILFE